MYLSTGTQVNVLCYRPPPANGHLSEVLYTFFNFICEPALSISGVSSLFPLCETHIHGALSLLLPLPLLGSMCTRTLARPSTQGPLCGLVEVSLCSFLCCVLLSQNYEDGQRGQHNLYHGEGNSCCCHHDSRPPPPLGVCGQASRLHTTSAVSCRLLVQFKQGPDETSVFLSIVSCALIGRKLGS